MATFVMGRVCTRLCRRSLKETRGTINNTRDSAASGIQKSPMKKLVLCWPICSQYSLIVFLFVFKFLSFLPIILL